LAPQDQSELKVAGQNASAKCVASIDSQQQDRNGLRSSAPFTVAAPPDLFQAALATTDDSFGLPVARRSSIRAQNDTFENGDRFAAPIDAPPDETSIWRQFPFDLGFSFFSHHADIYTAYPQVAGLFNPYIRRFPFPTPGPYPYRIGWSKYDDITVMPSEPTEGVAGSLQTVEWNASIQYSQPIFDGWLFTWTGVANTGYLSGPSGVALAGELDHLAADFELTTPEAGPWRWQIGFTPQMASDFQRSLNSNAYNFDGRAVLYYQASPTLTVALGAAFWNRVTDRVVPQAGIIWLPDDRWELRLLLPKSQISYRLGEVWGAPVWVYTSLEYTVNAYQVNIEDTRFKDRMETSDYRLLAGLTAQCGRFNGFVEGGLIFHRHVRFAGPTPDFNIHNGPIVRAGIKF
jgi:hypothetical protein